MLDRVTGPPADRGAPAASPQIDAVRDYWDGHVHDWKVARSPAGTREFFEEIEAYRYEKLHYLPRLVNFGGWAGKRLLDVGCGVGNDLSRFAKGGAKCTGIDLAPHSIELALANFGQRGLQAEFFVMDGEQLVFPDDTFDAVFCHTVLHFTPDPDRMVREIHRVLRPGGTAILMTVNSRSWLNRIQRLISLEIDHLDAPVFRQFTIAEFRALLAPFANVEIVPERFPVATKVHSGMKALLFNGLFVGTFNALPRAMTRGTGHHLMAFCEK
jgi:ubiquinone/menaquinone biosynthesis C-methylase UbiE